MNHLVADIGGTNARFSLARDGRLHGDALVLSSKEPDLWERAFAAFDGFDACCLAVAGPVRDQKARFTNVDLTVDAAALSSLSGRPVRLINDFQAVMFGTEVFRTLHQVGGCEADVRGVRVAIGPGSGCGMGVLVPTPSGWQALPSEGGHADLACASPLETELWQVLSERHGQVSWETVLSGPGLVRLHDAMAQVWGATVESRGPEAVVRLALDGDPLCHQTLETFFAVLGTAAGSLAVTLMATGGVYVVGGIVPTLVAQAQASPLRRRFDERGLMVRLAERIPIFIVGDEHPGLLGAHACLLQEGNA